MGERQAVTAAAGRGGAGDVRRTEALARFLRVLSAGATLGFVTVGVATADGRPGLGSLAGAVAAGLAFHVFAFVGNDVVDLPVDRADPRRARSPLVTGTVRPQAALAVALAALAVTFVVPAAAGAHGAAGPLALGAATLAAYNLAGKRMPVPFVADALQGVGFALLLLAGAWLGGGPSGATAWAAAYVIVFVAMTNSVHGGLRDAENDAATSAATTALLLGARASGRDGMHVPAPLAVWGALLQVTLAALVVGAAISGAAGGGLEARVAAVTAAGLTGAGTWVLGHAWRHRGDLRRVMASGSWHLVLTLAALVALFAPRLGGWAALAVVGAFLVPLVLFDRAVRGTPFTLPASGGPARPAGRTRPAALWEMTRPGNPAAAAALAAAGGAVAGGPWQRFAVVAAAVACVVVAANVFNDRCDATADGINRPDRPLPAGRVVPVDADRLVLAAGTAAVVLAALLGAGAALLVGGFLVLALVYSLLLRQAGLAGPLAVAVLFAAPVPVGGLLVSGEVGAVHALAAGLVATLVFAREALKAVPDVAGDAAAGYRTVATRFGRRGAIRLFRVGLVVFVVLLAAPPVVGRGGAGYLAAALLCAAAPAAAAVWRVRGDPPDTAVAAALDTAGRIFGLGFAPLVLLVATAG